MEIVQAIVEAAFEERAPYLKPAFATELRAVMMASPTEVDFDGCLRRREQLRLFGASGRIAETGAFRSPPTLHRSTSIAIGGVE